MRKTKELTPEQIEQKRKADRRVAILLIVINVLLVAYLVYQVITAVNK